MSYDDFKEFASLRKELHKLQVALEFYQKTTGQFGLEDLKVHFAHTFAFDITMRCAQQSHAAVISARSWQSCFGISALSQV